MAESKKSADALLSMTDRTVKAVAGGAGLAGAKGLLQYGLGALMRGSPALKVVGAAAIAVSGVAAAGGASMLSDAFTGKAKADDGKKPEKGLDGINADYSTWAGGTTPKAAAHIGALDSMIYQQNLRRAAAKGDPAAAAVADANTKPASTSAPPSREPSPDSTKAKIFSGITGMSAAATVASLVMRIPKLAAFNAMSTVMNGQIAGAYLNSSAKAKAQSAPERGTTPARAGASPPQPAQQSSYVTVRGQTVQGTDAEIKAWQTRRTR